MSHVTKRFKEYLQLAGYAKRSIESYASSVWRLQHFYNKQLNISLKRNCVNIGFVVKVNSAGAMHRCESVRLEYSIFSARYLSGPGTFLMKSSENVCRRFPSF
ncbi:MAG: hypothetical protein JW902_05220 [Syntrophaceae bacterium]|nr:hypothetical protein [Syntrophaceae bacterium]